MPSALAPPARLRPDGPAVYPLHLETPTECGLPPPAPRPPARPPAGRRPARRGGRRRAAWGSGPAEGEGEAGRRRWEQVGLVPGLWEVLEAARSALLRPPRRGELPASSM